MTVLVTGASSFVGAPLARALVGSGRDVRALSRSAGRLAGGNVTHYPGDIRDYSSVRRAVRGCESVIHLAYAHVTSSPREIMDVAVGGMSCLLRACSLSGVRDLLLVSSPWAENPVGYYGAGKLAQEMMASAWAESGVLERVVIARVFNAFGPDMGNEHVIPQFIRKMTDLDRKFPDGVVPFPVNGSGLDIRSFVYIDDCTAQLMALASQGGSGISRCDVGFPGEGMSVDEVAQAVGRCFGRQVRVIPLGPLESSGVRTPHPPPVLSRLCTTSFSEGLARTVEWYRGQENVNG